MFVVLLIQAPPSQELEPPANPARFSRAIEIEEEEALKGFIRIRRQPRDEDKEQRKGGGRFTLAPDFSVPGPFSARPTSAAGFVSFHFSRDIVAKAADGSSLIYWASGTKRLTSAAPAEHDDYVARPEAVMTISAADFEAYAGRAAAVDIAGNGRVALFTNIDADPAVRRDYWLKVHKHERTPNPDALEFHRSRLPATTWRRIAAMEQLPVHVRGVAASMIAPVKRPRSNKKKADAELDLDRIEAGKVLSTLRNEIGEWDWKHPPIRLRKGRGGRTQYRLTAEFPDGIDTAARLRIVGQFCRELRDIGVMYTAAIHAPDHHNDERNYHLHVAYHDRPARRMPDGRWDFEISEKVPGQWERYRYPHRQPKIAALSRDPDGGNSREYAASLIYRMREYFAELCNEELKDAGCGRLFDPRTYKAMGIDQLPTEPLGPRPAALEAVGIPTAKGTRNAETLWTAALQRNIKACEDAEKTRAALRIRVDQALRALAGLGRDDLMNKLRMSAARFDQHAQFLTAHEQEIGEFRITLMMAYARPAKTADTCARLLDAIEAGKASRSDTRDQELIEERLGTAERYLDGIDTIQKESSAVVDPIIVRAEQARHELTEITAALENLLAQEAHAALTQTRPVEEQQPRAVADPVVPSDRDLVDGLLDRIAREDRPVLLPDEAAGTYRVPGISREEYRLLSADRFSQWVQARLAGISKIQGDRMRLAAQLLRTHGRDGLEHMAATSSDARRALKHLTAYQGHPTLVALLAEPAPSPAAQSVQASDGIVEVDGTQCPGTNQPVQPRDAGVVERPPGAVRDIEASTFGATAVEVAPVAAPSSTARNKAIADYAEAIRTDPCVRLIEREGELRVALDSVPAWKISAQAFADEQFVRDAVKDRQETENEKIRSTARAQIIQQLDCSATRPVARHGDRWVIIGIDPNLLEKAELWRDHEELAAACRRYDEIWTAKEIVEASRLAALASAPAISLGRVPQAQANRVTASDIQLQGAFLDDQREWTK